MAVKDAWFKASKDHQKEKSEKNKSIQQRKNNILVSIFYNKNIQDIINNNNDG